MDELKGLLDGKMSWLRDLSDENIIIHNDIDAILCAGFLGEYAKLKNIVGIYDTRIFYLKDEQFLINSCLQKCIGVDLDFMQPQMRTLGHHITGLKKQGDSYNVNDIFGITENIKNIGSLYTSKYPLNEIIFLYSLFGMQPTTDDEIALLVYADTVFASYRNEDYMYNVRNWLKKLGQTNILDALDNRYPTIFGIIHRKILPLTKGFSTDKTFKQFSLTEYDPIRMSYKYIGVPQVLINLINKTLGWHMNNIPNKLNYKKELCYNKIILGDRKDKVAIGENLEKLNKILHGKPYVYSASLSYNNECKVTSSMKFSVKF